MGECRYSSYGRAPDHGRRSRPRPVRGAQRARRGAPVELWEPGGVERSSVGGELVAPEGIRAFFHELLTAYPDLRYELLDLVADDDRAAARYRVSGTFTGAAFQGLSPTGDAFSVEGFEVLETRGGRIVRLDQQLDQMELARQLGMLPPRGSRAERLTTSLFNVRTRTRRLGRRKGGS